MNREVVIQCADASGLSLYGMGKDREQFIDYLEAFADLVASAEREACAKVCEDSVEYAGDTLAEAIRAGGKA